MERFLLFSRSRYHILRLLKMCYCFVRVFEAEFIEGMFMLKRKPPAGNARRVAPIDKNSRGTFVNKAGRTVQFESFAERTLSLRFERDPKILDYSSQPVQFTFQDKQDKWHSYTPDFQVWKCDGTVEIHEVTRTERYSHPRMSQREAAADDLCKVEGWTYIVHTEETLPQPAEAANLLGLWRYRPTCYADSAVTTAARELLDHPMPFGKLLSVLSSRLVLPEPYLVPCLGHLLWHGTLSTDFNILIVEDGNILPDVSVWFPQ